MRIAQSSHIYGHEYDPQSRRLVIQFTNGAIYSYEGVPPTEYHNMAQSNSAGQYFHSKIKGRYETNMVAAGAAMRRK
jgi:hypothetical protein